MSSLYKIRVNDLKRDALFTYYGKAHPNQDETLYYRDLTYVVVSVGHVLTVSVDGSGESISLDFIELEVRRA